MLTYDNLDADQLAAIKFGGSGEDSLFCADVGTGKTAIGCTIAQEALNANRVDRWLVLAPLLVATDTWAREPAVWSHLDPSDYAIACGPEKNRIQAIDSGKPITITNYENLQWLMERYERNRGKDKLPFNGLMCDEIDKLKNVSSNRFKSFRNRLDNFNMRIGLTGTFMPTKLTDVWGQAFVTDGGQTFGRSFYEWRKKNFYPTDYQQRNWSPFHTTRQKIIDQLADLIFRLKAKDLPPVKMLEPAMLKMNNEQRRIYDKLERDYFIEIEKVFGGSHEIDAANAGVLTGKLQQITAGFSYVDGGKDVIWHDRGRFKWLSHLLDRLHGKQTLIFYHYNEELAELKRTMPGLAHLGKGTTNAQALKHIWDWNCGTIPHLALHPASAGHGLNLQKSNACEIAFLTMPWSGGMYKQVVGRLARRGNAAPEIRVHSAVYEHSIDQTVHDVLSGRLIGMEKFLDDLEKACSAAGTLH
jgi:hypothetical protein